MTQKDCPTQFQYIVNVLDPKTRNHICTGLHTGRGQIVVPASCLSGKNFGYPRLRFASFEINGKDVSDDEVVRTHEKPIAIRERDYVILKTKKHSTMKCWHKFQLELASCFTDILCGNSMNWIGAVLKKCQHIFCHDP